jgi:hypothetical protein
MRTRTAALYLLIPATGILAAGPKPEAGSLPPGRQYRLTIEGDNTVTFLPQVGLDPLRIDYLARVEYLVNTRSRIGESEAKGEGALKKKAGRKVAGAVNKGKKKDGGNVASKAASAVDVAIHASEMTFRQAGQVMVESRISRVRFQGRIRPDAPIVNVSYRDAPPLLQELLRTFDTTAASVLLDDRSHVLARRIRSEGPLHAVIETLLSIHTPIPSDVGAWEAPTQLAMGHGQTAKGILRFEKSKDRAADGGGLIQVKVSGVLKAEGAVVGNFIKDGTYTVTGEQSYDPRSRQWKSARWSVVVASELANAAGFTLAHAGGNMVVQTRSLDDAPPPDAKDEKP